MRAGSMFLVSAALSLGALVGCSRRDFDFDRGRERTDRTTTTSGEAPSIAHGATSERATTTRFDAEVQRLAAARCDRETRCNNVGANAKYESREHCLTSVKSSYGDQLNRWECKGGIDTVELDKCLASIRAEDCNNPIDTIGRVMACRSTDMCRAH